MEPIQVKDIIDLLNSGNFHFQPTQKKLCFPIIQRIHHKMKIGVKFENINVNDDLIINGHHRYVCSLLLKKTLSTNSWPRSLNDPIYQWLEIEIDSVDWESIDLIE